MIPSARSLPTATVLLAGGGDMFCAGFAAAAEQSGLNVACVEQVEVEVVAAAARAEGQVVAVIEVQGSDGLAIVGRLARLSTPVPTMGLVTEYELGYCMSLVGAGARGIVTYHTPARRAVDRVRAVSEGDIAFPAELLTDLIRHGYEDSCNCSDLSDQEIDVVQRLLTGATVVELAHCFSRSERDAHRLLRRIWEQMGVATRTEALVHAARCRRFASE